MKNELMNQCARRNPAKEKFIICGKMNPDPANKDAQCYCILDERHTSQHEDVNGVQWGNKAAKKQPAICPAAHPDPDYNDAVYFCVLNIGHGGKHKDADGITWGNKDRPRCGAKLGGKGPGCYRKPGHGGSHQSRDAAWPQKPLPPLVITLKCGCGLVSGHLGAHAGNHCNSLDENRGWFCELKPGHSGEHQCGEYRWPHSYGEAAPAPQFCAADIPASLHLPPEAKCEKLRGHGGQHQFGMTFWPQESAAGAATPEYVGMCMALSPVSQCHCQLLKGHGGDHEYKETVNWPQEAVAAPAAPVLSQKLVLHLATGDVEMGEADAKRLREQLNGIFGQPVQVLVYGLDGILRPMSQVAAPEPPPLPPGIIWPYMPNTTAPPWWQTQTWCSAATGCTATLTSIDGKTYHFYLEAKK